MIRPALPAVSAVLFALVATGVHLGWEPVEGLDRSVGTTARVSTGSAGWSQEFWLWVGHLTDTVAMTIYTSLIVVVLLIRRRGRLALWAAATMATVGLLNAVLKIAFARARPEWDDPLQVLTSYSFPSGHASGIAAFAGVMIVLARASAGGERRTMMLTTTFAAFLVVLVGWDRLALGVHHLSDVVGGWLLGVTVTVTWAVLLRPASTSDRPPAGPDGPDGILSA